MIESSTAQRTNGSPSFRGWLRRLFRRREPAPTSPVRARGPAYRVRNYALCNLQILHRGVVGVLDRIEALDVEQVDASELCPGDVVLVPAGQVVPIDGEIIEGCATLDQSAITGESAPVLREAGEQTLAIAGTRVLAGQIMVRVG